MAQVFLSYDREDATKARAIAQALEKSGHSVWWDWHIKGGAQYSQAIEEALGKADAVVVLWSKRAVESAWVRDEAAAGRDSGRLVPVLLEPVIPPMGFRQYQNIDLAGWKGRGRVANLKHLLGAVDALDAQGEAQSATATALPLEPGPRRWRLPVAALAAVAVIGILAALLFWKPWAPRSAAPIVAVVPADQSAGARALADALLVGLGNRQGDRDNSLQLVKSGTVNPDFIYQIAGTVAGSKPSATFILLRGSDGQILASRELAADPGDTASLKEHLISEAATLLSCAGETVEDGRMLLPSATMREYLTACDQFSDHFGYPDVVLAVPLLSTVVDQAPKFQPALKKLLLAEASEFWMPDERDRNSPEPLRRHLAQARRIDANMPEVALAESALLPLVDYAGRLRLMDRAVNAASDDPSALSIRATELMRVGRMADALTDAEKAVRLHPYLPFTQRAYVLALAYRGQIEKSFEAVRQAQRIAPTAANVREARFKLELRYGNAETALEMLKKYGTSRQHEAFLVARLDPIPANVERAIGLARGIMERFGYSSSFAEVLAMFGRDDDLYAVLMRMPSRQPDPLLSAVLFRPLFKEFRREPKFLRVAGRFGLLSYWRQSGKWPDFCFEPDLPYDCKVEAAKLG